MKPPATAGDGAFEQTASVDGPAGEDSEVAMAGVSLPRTERAS